VDDNRKGNTKGGMPQASGKKKKTLKCFPGKAKTAAFGKTRYESGDIVIGGGEKKIHYQTERRGIVTDDERGKRGKDDTSQGRDWGSFLSLRRECAATLEKKLAVRMRLSIGTTRSHNPVNAVNKSFVKKRIHGVDLSKTGMAHAGR